jgi:hypothetical protein
MEQIIKGIEAFNGKVTEIEDGIMVNTKECDERERFIAYVILQQYFIDTDLSENYLIGRCVKGDIDPY